jgi:hypothetical protein
MDEEPDEMVQAAEEGKLKLVEDDEVSARLHHLGVPLDSRTPCRLHFRRGDR